MDNARYKKKTGILGGTFNPIHIGHLMLAENALEYCGLDEVLIMPSGCSYFKDQRSVADPVHRLKMAELAISDNDKFVISPIEVERGGFTYTYETLEILCRETPNTRYYYIIGADTLFSMETWKKPDVIFSKCTVVCAKRNGVDDKALLKKAEELKEKYDAEVIIMDTPEIPVSSTVVREMMKKGMSCRYYLDDKVIKYIKDNGLYLNLTD
ncbi:MAG: nicotinate-nucleotide adenylyltransferase [Lachnospiraceae bacterium]|nr:nicotinate-nucleotide adenylyltransferase [Lachnospiraceae bacterium]